MEDFSKISFEGVRRILEIAIAVIGGKTNYI